MSIGACLALDLLKEWVKTHGTKNLSRGLTHGGKLGNRIYNQCQAHFVNERNKPEDLKGKAALEVACHLAGLEYTPGMLRSTTYQDDLKAILELYDAGEPLNDAAISKSEHRRLFHRAKKRAGMSWSHVFRDLSDIRPGLEFRRFFASSPDGVYVDLKGSATKFKSDKEIEAFATKMFSEYAKAHPEMKSICRLLGEGPQEVANLYWRLFNAGIDVHGILEKATGLPFPHYAAPGKKKAPAHTLGGAPHPPVASNAEFVVDTALAECVENYLNRHRHQIPLKELIPNQIWNKVYNGRKSPIIDILIDGKLAIEVSFDTDRFTEHSGRYTEKMDFKISSLITAGYHAVNIKIEDGAVANTEKLRVALDGIGIMVPDAEKMREILWAAYYGPGCTTAKKRRATAKQGPTPKMAIK